MPERLTFTATGTYDRAVPDGLNDALLDEIENHMKAYGFKEIEVETSEDPKRAAAQELYAALSFADLLIETVTRKAPNMGPVLAECFSKAHTKARAALLKANPARGEQTK
jgi:ribosomal protein S18 acetylase RimI-like enzyme